jgi:hypothetical protein
VVGLLAAGASAGPLSTIGGVTETLIDGTVKSERSVLRADEVVARSCHDELHDAPPAGGSSSTTTTFSPPAS